VAWKSVTETDETKVKIQRASSRRPGSRVRSAFGATESTRRRQNDTSVEQQTHHVGIDLHRCYSVTVRRDGDGGTLDTVHIDNDPVALVAELVGAGDRSEVTPIACTGRPT